MLSARINRHFGQSTTDQKKQRGYLQSSAFPLGTGANDSRRRG